MRISYYHFPEEFDNDKIFEALCAEGFYTKGERKRFDWNFSGEGDDPHLHTGRISWIKKMIRKYGGSGFTEHYERDGGLFDVTPIELKGNNSRFRYNHHL